VKTRKKAGNEFQFFDTPFASGMANNEILNDHPLLKEEHIRAALAFAANRDAFA